MDERKMCKVLFDHHGSGDNEINIKSGEVIELLDTSNNEWWKGTILRTRNSGFFPSNYVEIIGDLTKWNIKAKVIFDFEKDGSNELTIRRDQIIHVKEITKGDWWEGEHNGMVGFFPAAYVIVQKDGNQKDPSEKISFQNKNDASKYIVDKSPKVNIEEKKKEKKREERKEREEREERKERKEREENQSSKR